MIGNDLEKFTYIIKKVSGIWIIVSLSILLNKLLTALNDTFKKNEFFIKYPVNSYLQLIKLIIVIITAIFSICYALNLSPWGILSGVGALGAILLLVFKDTILGLIASIQVYGGKLLQEGDWIELKDLNIDGEVMEVGLHRVKVKAWDNTITTFPTAKFLEYTFKNWRGMTEAGGRRIKRSILISVNSISFCDKDLLDKLIKIELLDRYFSKKISENLLEDVFELILMNIVKHKKVKIAKFGTFTLRNKKQRIGRNPKTKETKIITERNVILFKPSKEFKEFINIKND